MLHRHVGEFAQAPEAGPHGFGVGRARDAHDGGMGLRADAPDMQIRDPRIAPFHALAHPSLELGVRGIEEHGGGVAHERPGPAPDDNGAQDPDRGIEPGPAQEMPSHQCRDGEHGGQRVRENVKVGGAQVVVGPRPAWLVANLRGVAMMRVGGGGIVRAVTMAVIVPAGPVCVTGLPMPMTVIVLVVMMPDARMPMVVPMMMPGARMTVLVLVLVMSGARVTMPVNALGFRRPMAMPMSMGVAVLAA